MSLFEYLCQGFKSIVDKIKTLDKKILIGGGIGIAAVIIAIVVILIVCLGGKTNEDDTIKENDSETLNVDKDVDDDSDSADADKAKAAFTVKVVDADGNAVSGVVVQVCKDSCVPATTDETGIASFDIEIAEGYKLSVLTLPEGYEYTGETEIVLEAGITEYEIKIQKKADGTNSGNTATQLDTTTKADGTEILGAGSKEQPYYETPNLTNMTLTTVSVPAGKTLYYGIYRVGGMILTINNSNAYVIESNGTRHDASGGKVTFTVEDELASDAVMFQIGNKGSSATTFTIQFTNPSGSYMNPTTATMNTNVTVSLSAGDSDGHWYKYIADRAGTIRFYLITSPDSNGLIVTNNRNSAQRTTEADAQVDSQGTYVELEVQSGDEILINVAAKPNNRGKYPATTITWIGKYN